MQDDRVVAPDVELETLNGGYDAGDVVGLAHGAEDRREDRILRIDGDQPVIATLVRVHREFRKIRHRVPRYPFLSGSSISPATET